MQPYLRYIYGDVFGFLAAWTWIVAVMPATLAILSIVFVESLYSAAGVTDQAGRVEHKLLSVLVLAVVGVANSISTRATTRLNGVFVGTKFFAIVAVVVAGLAVVALQVARPRPRRRRRPRLVHHAVVPLPRQRQPRRLHDALARAVQLGRLRPLLGRPLRRAVGLLRLGQGKDAPVSPVREPARRASALQLGHTQAIYITAELSAPARQLPLAINTAIAHHRAVVPGRQLGLLHPAPVGRGVDDRQHRPW